MSMTRREFAQKSLSTLVFASFLEQVFQRDAFADEIKPVTLKWLNDVNQLGFDLKGQMLKQTEWQKKIEELYAKVDLPDLMRLIDFEKLASTAPFVDNGAKSLRLKFLAIEGVPTKLSFGGQIFALKKGRSVVPHGHNNMATAFLILKGSFHGRHFDRLKDEKEHLIIRPTIDREFKTGECSSISDEKDNIHWFQAKEEAAFIYNIHVLGIRKDAVESTGRVYLDPNGEKLADGTIRAPRVNYDTVHKLYG